MTIQNVMLAVSTMMEYHNPDVAQDHDVYFDMKDNFDKYLEKAKLFTLKYAT